ncbi:MAG: preprotein translocase subunit SecE [Planctomycetota bacterium]
MVPDNKTETTASTPFLKPYRMEDGRVSRLVFFIVLLVFVAFTAISWFTSWRALTNTIKDIGLGFLVDWIHESDVATAVAQNGGAIALFLIGALVAYRIVFVKQKSSEFIIRTDHELSKVDWPKIKPWFKPETEVWGATYVVIITCILLSVYIYILDQILSLLAKWVFFS